MRSWCAGVTHPTSGVVGIRGSNDVERERDDPDANGDLLPGLLHPEGAIRWRKDSNLCSITRC